MSSNMVHHFISCLFFKSFDWPFVEDFGFVFINAEYVSIFLSNTTLTHLNLPSFEELNYILIFRNYFFVKTDQMFFQLMRLAIGIAT